MKKQFFKLTKDKFIINLSFFFFYFLIINKILNKKIKIQKIILRLQPATPQKMLSRDLRMQDSAQILP